MMVSDNYYHVVDGTVRAQVAEQESRHEKTREVTKGKFSSALDRTWQGAERGDL